MDPKIQKSKDFFLSGIKYLQNEDFENAEKDFLESFNLTPDRLSIINNLIQIYINNEDANKLENLIKKIDKTHIDTFEAQSGYAYLHFFKKKYTESSNILKKIKSRNIDEEKLLLSLEAKLFEEKNEFDSAKLIYEKIINISENNAKSFYNYGLFLMKINKTEEALKMLNKTLEMKSKIKFNEILWNKSLCELKLKNIDKGYKIYKPLSRTEYEKKFLKLNELTRIEDLISNPKKVLIWGDQGYGDMIIFSRFVKYISKKYKIKINLLFPKKIKELFIDFDENINLFENDEVQDLDIYDFQIRLSCLPSVINYKNFNDIEFYELILKPASSNLQKKTPNIGLAWSGRSTFSNDNLRSIPLAYFDKLLKKNFQFYKLQQEASENDIEILKKYSNITDLGSKSFFELANIIKQLDLVISCDTAIIHLAGTLNVKSYLLLNYNSHWIWFDDSKSNVWYPSVEIIKQIKMCDWSTVFQKLETNIAQLYS